MQKGKSMREGVRYGYEWEPGRQGGRYCYGEEGSSQEKEFLGKYMEFSVGSLLENRVSQFSKKRQKKKGPGANFLGLLM